MFIIDYVLTVGLILVLLVIMGVSASFTIQSWDSFKKYKDYMFVVFSLGLFGVFLMTFTMYALIMTKLLTGAVQ